MYSKSQQSAVNSMFTYSTQCAFQASVIRQLRQLHLPPPLQPPRAARLVIFSILMLMKKYGVQLLELAIHVPSVLGSRLVDFRAQLLELAIHVPPVLGSRLLDF